MTIKMPQITWFNNGEQTIEQLDNLTLQRFNIKNFKDVDDYKAMQNFYVFKVLDLDEKSETGYYGMFINKAYAQSVKQMIEKQKTNNNGNKQN